MYTCKCSPGNAATFIHAVANYASVCVTVLSTTGYTELTTSSIQQVSLPDKILQYMIVYVHRHGMYIYELHCLYCVCVCARVCEYACACADVFACMCVCVACLYIH